MMPTCKEASRLMSEGQDRELDLGQRTALRLHLFICSACSRVKKQMAFLLQLVRESAQPGRGLPLEVFREQVARAVLTHPEALAARATQQAAGEYPGPDDQDGKPKT